MYTVDGRTVWTSVSVRLKSEVEVQQQQRHHDIRSAVTLQIYSILSALSSSFQTVTEGKPWIYFTCCRCSSRAAVVYLCIYNGS